MPDGFFTTDSEGRLMLKADLSGEIDMWFETDSAGRVMPRATEWDYAAYEGSRNTDPGTSNVLAPTAYKIYGTDLVGTATGSSTPPAAPALAVTNNDDATVDLVVSGSTAGSSNAVYSQAVGSSTWTLRATISGDGTSADVSVTAGAYWWKCVSTKTGMTATSNIVFRTVTNSGSKSLQEQILNAVADAITAAGLTDHNDQAIVAAVQWPPIWTDWSTGQVKVFPDADPVEPMLTGVNEAVYRVGVAYCEWADGDLTAMTRQLKNRKSIKDLFIKNDPALSGVTSCWCRGETEQQTFFPEQLERLKLVSPLTFEFVARETRAS